MLPYLMPYVPHLVGNLWFACDMLIMLCYAMLHHIIGRHLVGNLYFFCAALSYAIL